MNRTSRVGVMVFLFFILSACTRSNTIAPTEIPQPTEIPHFFRKINNIVFAGKVVNKDSGEWVNNRLVLIFLKGREIARGTSATTEILFGDPYSKWKMRYFGSNGVEDGLFAVTADNTYQLTIPNLGIPGDELPFMEGYFPISKSALISWLDPIYEGETREYAIPSKNLSYVLFVIPGDYSQLPEEIKQPGSVRIIDGNRLVAVDPQASEPAPLPPSTNVKFDQVQEEIIPFTPAIFPINNCGGTAEVKQEITQTYIHEIIDESRTKLGIELPIFSWLQIVAEVENHYGISDKQITVYSTVLTVPPNQNIQYTVARKQTWESGMATVNSSGIEIAAPYRILKSETFEVVSSEQKSCP